MSIFDVFTQPVWQRVAVSLLHFVWQGAAIAALLAVVLKIGWSRTPQTRYVATLAALLAMAICPVATFCLVEPPPETAQRVRLTVAGESSARPEQPATETTFTESTADGATTPTNGPSIDPPTKPATRLTADADWRTTYNRFAPYVVTVWLLGGLLFACRLLFGVGALAWMTRRRIAVPDAIAGMLDPLCRRMHLKRRPAVFACDRCPEAMALGWLKPVVLIPASWLAEVQPDVLEAVFAHELAHIRRRDMWVNLLQRILETILFYHPAVWWVSSRLRTEREFCCDDLAVAATGRRAGYAEALEWVARIGAAQKTPVLAMTIGGKKMALLNRVRHVLKTPTASRQGGWLAAGFATLLIPALLWMALLGWNPLSADDTAVAFQGERGEKEKPREKRAGEERRERGEREERGERRERGEREERGQNGERGERKRGERERGERREGERRREGDRPREEGRRREGDRPREGGERRPDRDRPREGDRRREGGPDGKRGERPREEPRFDRRGPANEMRELMKVIRELREEVAQLRREMNELRGRRGGPPPRTRREGDRPPERRAEGRPGDRRPDDVRRGDRRQPDARRGEGEGRRPERDEPKRDRDRKERPEVKEESPKE